MVVAVVMAAAAVVVETVVILLLQAGTAQSIWLLGYRLDNLGIRSQTVQEFLFSKMPRLALAHIQPPIQWVLRTLFPASKVPNM